MSTVSQVQLVAPRALATTDAAVYTVPTQVTVKIGRAVFCNTGASAVTVTAGITTGGALGASNTLISALPLAPGESYVAPELSGAVLPALSQLHAYASASGVVFTASGLSIQ
jgi:hypothetical protein